MQSKNGQTLWENIVLFIIEPYYVFGHSGGGVSLDHIEPLQTNISDFFFFFFFFGGGGGGGGRGGVNLTS